MNVVSTKVLPLLRPVTVAALAVVALVAVPPGSADAAGVPCQRTISSGPVNVKIPDLGQGRVDLAHDVPEDGLVVSDVDVAVDIRHPEPTDLRLTLSSRTDTDTLRKENLLFDQHGSTEGADMPGTTFDDEASVPITSVADAPFLGSYRPREPLATHDGVTGGRYALVVEDLGNGDEGTLVSWSLTLTYAGTCDLDADGVEDHDDKCLGPVGRTATGCPVASRKVTASQRKGKVKGVLSSSVTACSAAREVVVRKVSRGPDRKVGAARTRADGSWRLARAKKPGRYYATSPRGVVPDAAECPAVRSRTFRVR
jgi:subtilisin-like proprotein convertase family protein